MKQEFSVFKSRTHSKCDFNLGPDRECRLLDLQHVASSADEGTTSHLKALLIELPSQFKADGITGSDFFRQNAIFIDLANQRVALRKTDQR